MFAELRNLSQLGEARKQMQEKLTNWLQEEGYETRTEYNPNAYFELGAKQTKRLPFRVIHPTSATDRIHLLSQMMFGEATDKIKQLQRKDRLDLVWDLCYSLLGMGSTFAFVPNTEKPTSIVFNEVIYYDGMTKDRFMSAVEKIERCSRMVSLKLDQRLGGESPKINDSPFYG